jgi:hypothetical protein
LQGVIECGSYELQEGIAERIVHDIVDLSEHHIRSHVVEACIHLTCSLAPLLLVLNAFQYLDDDELSQLVQGSDSNYVVQKLLRTGKSVCIHSPPPISHLRYAEKRVCWAPKIVS